jgi:NDP-sugar pyrophosphorylase family protein
VLEPMALQFLNDQQQCDMPELFERLRIAGNHTVAYPMHEPWLDVGRPDDLNQIMSKLNLYKIEANNGKN